jgi:hypothetical protein
MIILKQHSPEGILYNDRTISQWKAEMSLMEVGEEEIEFFLATYKNETDLPFIIKDKRTEEPERKDPAYDLYS